MFNKSEEPINVHKKICLIKMKELSFKQHVLFFSLILIWLPLLGKDIIIKGKIIKGDEYWTGRVIISGDVIVARTGRLLINPGTEILFKPNADRKHSGRDKTRSEIVVRGILSARGTAASKIRFSSAAKQPRMGDWYGITISNPKRQSTLEYVVVEYAYNGINIKKSDPLIRNSQIQFNYNAGIVAEVGSKAKITGNIISDNGYAGVICNTGARPVLADNMITKNEIGIIIMGTAHPNLGNMAAGKSNNIGRNGIFDNQKYNIYNHSVNDIKAENNSWGTRDAREIMAMIYDGGDDRKFGAVDIAPVLGGALNLEEKIILAQNNPNTQAAPAVTEQTGTPTTSVPEKTSQPAQTEPQKIPQAVKSVAADSIQIEQPAQEVAQNAQDTVQKVKQTVQSTPDTVALAAKPENQPAQPTETKKKSTEPAINFNQVFLDVFLDRGREIIKKVRPVISNPERGLRAHGRVIIRVIVGKNGFVESAKVLRGLNPYYDGLALEAAKKFTFRPGTVKGTPVRFSTSILFEF